MKAGCQRRLMATETGHAIRARQETVVWAIEPGGGQYFAATQSHPALSSTIQSFVQPHFRG